MDVPPDIRDLLHVAAMTRYVQADTLYDLDTRSYRAHVQMLVTTKVLYPYMLISDPDETTYPDSFADYTPPLWGETAWYPPEMDYFTTNYPGINTEFNITFLSEDTAGCTFIDSNNIADNNYRECEQKWQLDVRPLDGACFIDGEYRIVYGARCFYDKPNCIFGAASNATDDQDVQNTVTLILDVESTNMCPQLVHDVDLYGELCDTGRDGWMRCADFIQQYPCGQDAAFCDGPPASINTYFQNDDVYFFVEIDSADARVIYSEITDIYTTPTSTVDPNVPNDPNLFTTALFLNGVAQSLSWTNSATGTVESVRPIIWADENSNYFADIYASQGKGDTDLGNFAGYAVYLDERIFPAPTDGFYDVTFTVVVKVYYEGWGDDKPTTRRRLSEQNYPLSGQDTMYIQQPVKVQRRPIDVTECTTKTNMKWAMELTTLKSEESLKKDLEMLVGSEDFTLESQFELQKDSHTVVFSSTNTELWESLNDHLFYRPREFQTSAYGSVKTVSCIDVPEEEQMTSLEAVQCGIMGQPCSVYGGQTLEEYLEGPEDSDSATELEVEDSSASSLFLFSVVAIILAAF